MNVVQIIEIVRLSCVLNLFSILNTCYREDSQFLLKKQLNNPHPLYYLKNGVTNNIL